MGSVPSHKRTRTTHGAGLGGGMAGSRRTHGADAYLPAISGAEEVYQQIQVDEAGQVTAGGIAPGAVTGAAFASTIAPVLLVHGLPTLPNSAYPVDIFVYDIDASPKRLYKNVADVWTALIGPDDIQADSITAGQIAAGAISTSELAVGARLTGEVANEVGATPGVFIDSTGILIRSGKLTLEDEFGTTALQASGFSGTWSDFIGRGLYNAAFVAGSNAALALGRTSQLPFWTVARDNAGVGPPTYDNTGAGVQTRAASALFPGGFRVRSTFGALSNNNYLISDAVPVTPGAAYVVRGHIGFNRTAGNVGITAWIRWLTEAGATISEDLMGSTSSGVTVAPQSYVLGSFQPAPSLARFAKVVVWTWEDTTHNAANSVDVGAVSFSPQTTTGDIAAGTDADLGTTSVSSLQITAAGFLKAGGSSFPGSPTTNDLFFRTDLGMWYQYNGTRWLCTCDHQVALSAQRTLLPISATVASQGVAAVPALNSNSDIWLVRRDISFFVVAGTALDGANNWTVDLRKTQNNSATETAIGSALNINSGTLSVWRTTGATIGALLNNGTTHVMLLSTWTKTGTPGNLYSEETITYRFVAT